MARLADVDRGAYPEALVGRRREFATLRAAFESAVAANGRLVVLTGEPGVGKTRVAEEFAAWSQEEVALVMRGRCREGEGAPAYGPWVEALGGLAAVLHEEDVPPPLARLVPRLLRTGASAPPASPEGEDRFHLFNAVVDALRVASSRCPTVMLVDDVQWADRSSAQLLAHVVPELDGLALLIVATCRSGWLRRGNAWREALAHIAQDPAYESLDVPPLTRQDLAALLELAAGAKVDRGVVDAVHERTGGNAFFVEEVIRTLLEEGAIEEHRAVERLAMVPHGVRAVVGQRLDRLSAPAVDVLGAAAMIGTAFSPELAAMASGTPLDVAHAALDEAAEAQVVGADRPPSREWRFVHAIVRDVVAEDVPIARRAELNRAIGEALATRWETGLLADAAAPARHFVAAARAGAAIAPAVTFSLRAAEQASAVAAWSEAAGHYERVLELLGLASDPDPRACLTAQLGAGEAHTFAGDIESARRYYELAAHVARQLEDAEAFARAALGFAEWVEYGVVDRPAIDLLREALRRLPPGPGSLRAAVLGRLAVRLSAATDQERRESMLDEAIEMSRGVDDQAGLATLLALSPLVNWRPPRAQVRAAAAEESIRLAHSTGHLQGALWAHIVRFSDAFAAGTIAKADAELEAYAALSEELRLPYYRWYLMVLRAARAAFAGDLAHASPLSEEAHAFICKHEADADQEYVVQQVMFALLRDRPADADAEAVHTLADRHAALPMWRAHSAALDARSGDLERAHWAVELLCRDEGAQLPPDADLATTLSLLADAVADIGELAHARMLSDRLIPYAKGNVVTDRGWAAWGSVARRLGRLALLVGDEAGAARHLDEALELERAWGARGWYAHTLWERSRLYTGSDREAARAEVAEIAGELGLAGLAGRTAG